jgi:uncharacterized protein (DUF2267 family)
VADLLERVRVAAGLSSRDVAKQALKSLVCALRERLSAEEVDELRTTLHELPDLFLCDRPDHSHKLAERVRDRLTEPEVAERVQTELGLPDLAAGRRVSRAVLSVLAQDVPDGAPDAPGNEAVSVGALGRPRRGSAEDEDDGS